MIIGFVLSKLNSIRFRKQWRAQNTHNMTVPVEIFPMEKVTVGKNSYGPLLIKNFGNPSEKLTIGNYVSISSGVTFILGGNHRTDTFTNFPVYSILINNSPEKDALVKGSIIVEDEVWIGTSAIIMSGVKIGRGAIIAAGAVIVKDVPNYAIVGGNPAKVIKYRFEEDIRDALNDIKLSDFHENDIVSNIDMFYESLTLEQIKKIKKIKEDNSK